ncbi:MAG: HesA/MoeB/ThiF family protein [Candidatus Bathyarchaeia archaeon]|jgi:adenylyltransferase/sulfurtransferase
MVDQSKTGCKPESVKLSKAELAYYSRQVNLRELGLDGQLRLKNSRVCVLGVGGLGSCVAVQLAGLGVGFVRIVDKDVVDVTNLHRQHLYCVEDVGQLKVEVAAKRLRGLNPFITVEPLNLSVDSTTVEALIKDVDVVVDGLDSMAARYEVNRACIKFGVPYVFGAAVGTSGNLSTVVPTKTACLECFYGGLDDSKLHKCDEVGVHPSVVKIIASLEVSEAVRLLTGREPCLVNKLLYVDLDQLEFSTVQVAKAAFCSVCGK